MEYWDCRQSFTWVLRPKLTLSGLHGKHYPLSPEISSFLCEVDERKCEMVAATYVGDDPTLMDPSFMSLS